MRPAASPARPCPWLHAVDDRLLLRLVFFRCDVTAGGKLADRWSATAVLALSGILHAMILFALALFTTIPTFWLFAFITAVAFGIGDPAFDAFLAKATPPERLGLTFGLFDTALSFFTPPFPYLGGLLWEQVQPTTPFWVGGVFLAVAGVVTWYWIRPFEKM